MKRISVFVIILMLLVSLCHAEQNKEIVFSGIPWGTSAVQTLELMQEKGYDAKSISNYWAGFVEYWPLYPRQKYVIDCEYEPRSIRVNNREQTPGLSSIAGYEATTIEAFFIPVVNGEEILTTDDKIGLYAVKIAFDFNSETIDIAYTDLVNKLSSLYGYGQDNSSNWSPGSLIWYGDNQTAVAIYKSKGTLTNRIDLIYGKTDSENKWNEFVSIITHATPTANPNDFSGL